MMKRDRADECLVTGGTGFLGRYLTDVLRAQGCRTTILSRSPRQGQHIIGDLGRHDLDLGRDSFSTVYHLAGLAHRVPRRAAERETFFQVNSQGTERLLKSLERLPSLPRAVVFASTIAVYGCEEGELLDESIPRNASDPYGLSKRQAEDIVLHWCEKRGVRAAIVRLPVMVGMRPAGNIGSLARALSRRRYFGVGTGNARRSMVLAADVANILPRIADVGGVFHLTDGHHPSFMELEQALCHVLCRRAPARLPVPLAKCLAHVGDVLQKCAGRSLPFNSRTLRTMTSTLTFCDQRARRLLSWSPSRVVDHMDEVTRVEAQHAE